MNSLPQLAFQSVLSATNSFQNGKSRLSRMLETLARNIFQSWPELRFSYVALSGWLFRQVLVGEPLGHFFRDSAEVAVQ